MKKLTIKKYLIFSIFISTPFIIYGLFSANKYGVDSKSVVATNDSLKKDESAKLQVKTVDQLKMESQLRQKYSKILSKYWKMRKFGRKGVSSVSFNATEFENDHPSFKRGRYSNEYVATEKGYKITMLTGEREKVDVEPIK